MAGLRRKGAGDGLSPALGLAAHVLLPFIAPALLALLWELLARHEMINSLFFPPPSEVTRHFWRLWREGALTQHLEATLTRLALGFTLGAVPGVMLGMVIALSPPLRALLMPTFNALYPIPRIAVLPLIIVIMGLGEAPKLFIVAFSVFFILVMSTVSGVREIPGVYFEVARNFGAGRLKTYLSVALPGALPAIMTGARLAMGFALIVVIGTEFLIPSDGIGALIWRSYQIFDVDTMYAGLLCSVLLGWVAIAMVDLADRVLVPWRPRQPVQARLPVPPPVRVWFRALRPFSFTASIIPVLVGTVAAARYEFHPLLFLITLIASVAIHAGTNLVNDYYDHVKGVDSPQSLGPAGLIQRGILTPRQVLVAGLLAFAAGSALGLILVWQVGLPVLWLGILSVLAGFFYTAGPAAFAYIGLGEIIVFIFMGPVMVMGSYYVQVRQWTWEAFLLSLPVGFLVAAILQVNNLRDLEEDRAHGKRTLATFLGRRLAKVEYYALVIGAYLAVAAIVLAGLVPWAALVALATLPIALRSVQTVMTRDDAGALNRVLRQTAQLHLRFGLLLTLGLAFAVFIKPS